MGSGVAIRAHSSTSVRLGTSLQLILHDYIAGHEAHYGLSRDRKRASGTAADERTGMQLRDYLPLKVLRRAGKRVSELLNIRPRDAEAHNQVVNIVKAKGEEQRRVLLLNSETLTISRSTFSTQTPPEDWHIFSILRYVRGSFLRKMRVWPALVIAFNRTLSGTAMPSIVSEKVQTFGRYSFPQAQQPQRDDDLFKIPDSRPVGDV